MLVDSLEFLEEGAEESFYCLDQYKHLLEELPDENGKRDIILSHGISIDKYWRFDAEEIFDTVVDTFQKAKKGRWDDLADGLVGRLKNIITKTVEVTSSSSGEVKTRAFTILTVSLSPKLDLKAFSKQQFLIKKLNKYRNYDILTFLLQNQLNDLHIQQSTIARKVQKLCNGIYDESKQFLTNDMKSYTDVAKFIEKMNKELAPHYKLAYTAEESFRPGFVPVTKAWDPIAKVLTVRYHYRKLKDGESVQKSDRMDLMSMIMSKIEEIPFLKDEISKHVGFDTYKNIIQSVVDVLCSSALSVPFNQLFQRFFNQPAELTV